MTNMQAGPDDNAENDGLPQTDYSINRLGLASHHYGKKENLNDFSSDFIKILHKFDSLNCDSVLFSLYTINNSNYQTIHDIILHSNFDNIKSIFFEEFGIPWKIKPLYHVLLKNKNWKSYNFTQHFGYGHEVDERGTSFVNEFCKRCCGNFAVLLCGETNIVRIRQHKIVDENSFLVNIGNIHRKISVILNPVHDKMDSRMTPKRAFLSKNSRVVVSVWNKGKIKKNGDAADGKKSLPWAVYYDGNKVFVPEIDDKSAKLSKVTLGIVDINHIIADKS